MIQQQPRRICKFGHTANLKERNNAHKRTFKPPYFFELLHVVEVDDAKKAEDIFRNTPDIKNNNYQVKIGNSVQQETFLMPETLTDATVYHHMRKAARQSTSMDIVMSDAQSTELEIEREKTKQLKLQTRQEIVKATQDHEYRMALLKTGRVKWGEAVSEEQSAPLVVRAREPEPMEETRAYNESLLTFIRAECEQGARYVVHASSLLSACNRYFAEVLRVRPITSAVLKDEMEALR